MIIKTTRLQAWGPTGGGGMSRPSPPPLEKKSFGAILGAFLLRFSHFWGPFTMWGPFCYFYFMGGGGGVGWTFFGLAPPTKISAGAHDCKEGSRACSPEIVLCDRNLVGSGHVLLRFCLKNDKNNDKL